MLNKREIWEICKKLLNMISDSMLHFFALYVFMTGFNTLYCIQHDKQTAMWKLPCVMVRKTKPSDHIAPPAFSIGIWCEMIRL